VSVEGNWYYLRDCGCMAIGSCHIEGADCLFREDGVLLFAQQLNNDGGYYVVYDRQAASEYISPDQHLLLG
jgi:glucan-binding YG repeat protein